MGNDFFNELNNNCVSREEIEKEKKRQQKQIEETKRIELLKAQADSEKKYNKLINEFVDIFKDEAIKAVSNGKYALKGNNKVLKGNILFDKYSENIADEYTVYNLSLDCKFYEPKEKSTLLGKKIVWSEDTSITAQKGCLYFYESMHSILSDDISIFDKCFQEKCDTIITNDSFLLFCERSYPAIISNNNVLMLIKKCIPTIQFDSKWKYLGQDKYKLEFTFTF